MMEPKYPTAEEARDAAVYLARALGARLDVAIERAQWAAVREAIVAMSCSCIAGCRACVRGDLSPHEEERYIATVCERCTTMREAERHLDEGDA